MVKIKQIGQRDVVTFDQPHLEFTQETTDRQPEVVAHHQNAMDTPAIALPQGLHQAAAFLLFVDVQPLFELIEDDQHFFADGNP